MIAIYLCAAFLAVTLVIALIGSRALRTFFGVIGGALFGLLLSGVFTLGFLGPFLLVVPAGCLFGALLGAAWRAESGSGESNDTEDLEF
jgi:hypothetical protein